MRHLTFAFISILLTGLMLSCSEKQTDARESEWEEYLGGPDRNHYSSLDQITLSNVSQLEKAWEYHTGDSGQVQCNPIIVDGVVYALTATVQPFALDAATGREIWRVRDSAETTWYGTGRGVVYWEDGADKRILYTKEEWLCAVDALTGKPVQAFGEGGKVSLRAGLGPTAADKFVISNTPGTLFEDLIIMPLRLSEGNDAALGHIQAFNVRTGQLAWVFKTIPEPGETGYDTWPAEAYKNTEVGAANNWAGMAVDRERGIVYAPTGSAAFDFYGGNRVGANLFANTLLALDARTGERIWHFQLVHHDILDRDPPAPPNLITVTHNGRQLDAVAQVTKQGFVYVFDRETGEPLFPIEEVPMPASDIPGEEAWPTQPIPVKPAPYARQTLAPDDINPFSENREELLHALAESRNEGPFAPLSKQGTVVFPGLDGGAEWGGAAVDPNGIMYVNSNEMAWLIALDKAESENEEQVLHAGERVYLANCSVCHQDDLKGNVASGFPSLVDLATRMGREQALTVITSGKGMMPAFKSITEEEQAALIAYLYGDDIIMPEEDKKEPGLENSGDSQERYAISGYTKFLDKDGYPAISPPWGTLNAIDLNTGEYLWKKTFGEYPDLIAKGIPPTGSESYGGPVITASGVLFIAGTKDKKLRAYNMKNGDLVWETLLPAASFATPSTYEVDGRQYLVVACGGTKLGAEKGDSYMAFRLPNATKD